MSPDEPARAAMADAAAPEPEPPAADPAADVEAETPNSVLSSQLADPGGEQASGEAGGPGPMGPMVVPVRGPTMGISGAIGDAWGDFWDSRPDEERLDAREELEDFRNTDFPDLKNYEPSSGRGLFDVACDMRTGRMTITLKVGYNFVDGYAGHVGLGFPPDEFKWKPEEIATWKARYQRDVAARWSSRFQIRSTRKYWESMVVNTTVRIVEDSGAPHFRVTVGKYPSDAKRFESSVCSRGFHHDRMTGKCVPNTKHDDGIGTAELDSNDLRSEQKLDELNASTRISFEEGSASLSPDAMATIRGIASSLSWSDHVELTGRNKKHDPAVSQTDGVAASMTLARARTAAVQAAFLDGGASSDQILVRNLGENDAGDGPEWCRVDVTVGTHQTQSSALHETGHMLGGVDEYPEPGEKAGAPMPPRYDAMIKTQTGDTVTAGTNESAMSLGMTVQRWNYAAFLEALKAATGNSDWSL